MFFSTFSHLRRNWSSSESDMSTQYMLKKTGYEMESRRKRPAKRKKGVESTTAGPSGVKELSPLKKSPGMFGRKSLM